MQAHKRSILLFGKNASFSAVHPRLAPWSSLGAFKDPPVRKRATRKTLCVLLIYYLSAKLQPDIWTKRLPFLGTLIVISFSQN